MVINFDLPMVAEDYVHRIGRTGRAGAEGLAVSLVSHDEARLLRDIRRLLKQDIAIENVEGFEPSSPLRLDGNGGGQPKQNAPARKPNPARCGEQAAQLARWTRRTQGLIRHRGHDIPAAEKAGPKSPAFFIHEQCNGAPVIVIVD